MSKGDWYDEPPLRGLIAILGTLAMFALLGVIGSAVEREQAYSRAGNNSAERVERPHRSAAAMADEVCPEAQQEIGGETKQRDLCAQFQAAAAASRAADWTETQAYIGIGGLLAVLVALYINILATNAATEQSRTARRSLENLERPHIRVDAEGLEEEVIKLQEYSGGPETEKYQYSTTLTFFNYGRDAAILTSIDRFLLVDDDMWNLVFDPSDTGERGGRALPFGHIVMARDKSDPFPVYSKRREERPNMLSTWWLHGFIRYEDAFRNKYVVGFCFERSGERWLRGAPGGRPSAEYNYSRNVERKLPPPKGWRQRWDAVWKAATG